MAVIEIRELTRDFDAGFLFRRRVRALDRLNLDVRRGEIFGFLGPNGAGKTTTLKILMNLIRPTSGSARVLGQPVDSVEMRRCIGYLPENPYFYDYLSAEELLTYIGRLFGMKQPALSRKVRDLLEMVGLAASGRTPLRKFSKGMVQRIGIAQAIINDPDVVFLDEPMSGLDPLGRREVRDVIASLKSKGVTVFFSSHILPDVEVLCDRVAIMNRGRLQDAGALEDILGMRIQGHDVVLANMDTAHLNALKAIPAEVTPMGDRVHVRAGTGKHVEAVLAFGFSRGAQLISVTPVRPSLEDYFLEEIAAGAAKGGAR